MLSEELQFEILHLHFEEAASIREISSRLKLHRNTVRKYLDKLESCDHPDQYFVRPVSKGKWDALLIEAEKNVRANKRTGKIKIKDVLDEIREHPSSYWHLGWTEGEVMSVSTFYLAWKHLKQKSPGHPEKNNEEHRKK
ncbi:hypothetical protein NYE40_23925 [Paenibacillus sp. FSL W8-1187]|uniref:hypothetical protein n=1 Tax=Paenibacillus sp. FSL W8-1187 TaxID=2975339 RepID=UPI0030DA7DE1